MSNGRPSILIVDDNVDIATMLGEFLTATGYQVTLAHDGSEGLEKLQQRPDLLLLDVEMPQLTGPEVVYRMLIHNAGLERIPVALLSGVVGLPILADKVGTPYFLAKPFELDVLLTMVRRALMERTPPKPGQPIVSGDAEAG